MGLHTIELETGEVFTASPMGHIILLMGTSIRVSDFVPIEIPGVEDDRGVYEDEDEEEGLQEVMLPPGTGNFLVGEQTISFSWDAVQFLIEGEVVFDQLLEPSKKTGQTPTVLFSKNT